MSEQNPDAVRREWTRIAHDAMHKLDELLDLDPAAGSTVEATELRQQIHEALHNAVEDDPVVAQTAAADLRPFDRAFTSIANQFGVAAVWVAALNGQILSGGHVELNRGIMQVIHAGAQAMQSGAQAGPRPGLWTPNGQGSGIVLPEQGS